MKRVKSLLTPQARRTTATQHETGVVSSPKREQSLEQEILQELRSPSFDNELVHPAAQRIVEFLVNRYTIVSKASTPAVNQHQFTVETTVMPAQHTITKVPDEVIMLLEKFASTLRTTEKAIARQIVAFLNLKYGLSSEVVIENLLGQDKALSDAELSKAQSQLAIATQRAAALFALRANLLEASREDLERHMNLTRESLHSMGFSDVSEFVSPFQEQLKDLKAKLTKTKEQRDLAQQLFQERREAATRPIMELLQKSNAVYAKQFRQLDPTQLESEVKYFELAKQQGDLRQKQFPDSGAEAIDAHTVDYLKLLYHDAFEARMKLQNFLSAVQLGCRQDNVEVKVEMGALKGFERAMEKTVEEYEGDFSRLVDLVRASFVCTSVGQAAVVLKVIREMTTQGSDTEVVRIKNRLDRVFPAAAESGGYRDVLMNLRFNKSHICEIQIQIQSFMNIKTGGGHKIYSSARSLHLLDPELSQVRIRANTRTAGGNDIRKEFTLALRRVENGTCQGLYLNHFRLTVAECKKLRDALGSPACNVRQISLAHCGLNAEKGSIFCQRDAGLGNFLVVDLQGNPGVNGECVKAFVSEDLKRLSIQQCYMNEDDGKTIADAISHSKPYDMQSVNVIGNNFGRDWTQSWLKCLKNVPKVFQKFGEPLTSQNEVDPELQSMLILALISRSIQTIELVCLQGAHPFTITRNIRKVPVVVSVEQDFAEGLGCMLRDFKLTHPILDLTPLDGLKISNSCKETLCQNLPQLFASSVCKVESFIAPGPSALDFSKIKCLPNITKLAIHHSAFDRACTKDLVDCFDRTATQLLLLHLDLEGCQIGDDGVEILLKWNDITRLETLNLSQTGISQQGASHFENVVLPNLICLKVAKNDFSRIHISTLVNLKELDVEGSQLTAEYFAEQLRFRPHLMTLSLKDNQLGPKGAENLAPALTMMTNMTSLNLANNQLGPEGAKQFAPALTAMTNMTNLNLAKNKLGPDGVNHFAPALTMMPNMTCLNLEVNELGPQGAKHLGPALTTMTNMTSLNLINNQLGPEGAKHLAPALTAMTNMTNLNLFNNQLGSEGVMCIAPALTTMTNMAFLNLEDNKFGPEGAKHLAPALIAMPNMTSLNLMRNVFGPEGAKHLAPALAVMTNMTSLNYEVNELSEGVQSFAPALTVMTNVTSLNLQHNQLGPEGAKHLAPALAVMTNMTDLKITNNNFGPEEAKHLAPALTTMTNMANLNLMHNQLGPEGAKHLAPALATMTNMTDFNSANCSLGPFGAKHLAPALALITNMTSLNFQNNQLGPEGAKHLAPALTVMTNMTSLNLENNQLGPEGAKHLAPALTAMTNMTNLILTKNELGPEGAKHLAPALTVMTNMTDLNLENNQLGPEGAKHLAQALATMTNMTSLNLQLNQVGSEGAKHLAPALATMTNMTNLNLMLNQIQSEGARHLTPALTTMTKITTLNLQLNGLEPATKTLLKETFAHIADLSLADFF